MGKIRLPHPVKLIFGFIFQQDNIYNQACSILVKHFGGMDFNSSVFAFVHTKYYEKEMGTDLKRKFIAAKKLVNPAGLYKIKILTNKIEEKLSKGANRLINIDPGCLDFSKLVLASTKDYYHRIYLNKGIFAETTLFFKDKAFRAFEWTYPDYKEYVNIFEEIRTIYAKQIKSL